MSKQLLAKPLLLQEHEQLKKRVETLELNYSVTPFILIIRVGNRQDDLAYEQSIIKNCYLLKINYKIMQLDLNVTQKELEQIIHIANNNNLYHGIMVFRPLPKHINTIEIAACISPYKDIDCTSLDNLKNVLLQEDIRYIPCTAQAVLKIIDYYKIKLKGLNVTIIGASLVVGKPLAMMLLERCATITIAHKYTNNLKAITQKSDLVISAAGQAKFLTKDYFNNNSIIIDVGINIDENRKRCGDVDYENVNGFVKAITPIINGVGSVTTTILLENVIYSCERMQREL